MACESCPACGGFCGLDGAVSRDGCVCLDPWFCDEWPHEEKEAT